MVVPVSSSEAENVSEAPQPRRRWRSCLRWGEHAFALICLLAILVLFTPLPGLLYLNLDRQSPLEKADCIICLGGDPARILEATKLLQEGYAPRLIVSNVGARAELMKQIAVEWGAPADQVLVDHGSRRTVDHPDSVAKNCGVHPDSDHCIIVTTMTHMARSKATFEKAGYKHLIMREPRWERYVRSPDDWGWRGNVMKAAEILYEYVARLQYWALGYT